MALPADMVHPTGSSGSGTTGSALASNEKPNEPSPQSFTIKQIVGLLVAVIAFLGLFFMPQPEGLDVVGQRSLAMFVAALILWITRPFPIYLTSLLAVVLLPLLKVVESQKVSFGTLGYGIIWLMVAAFVLTSAMSASNLGKRIALTLVTKFGKTPKRTLFVLVVVNFILAFFVPSTTARASLLVPIALVLLEVYKLTPQKSNFGRLMMLQGVQSNAFATSVVMTATSAQVLAIGFINQQLGVSLGYMQWLIGSLPQAVLVTLISFFVGLKLYAFKDELQETSVDTLAILKQNLKDLGPLSLKEKKAMVIFLVTLFLWATGDYQKAWWGFKISTELTAVISMILCLMPVVGVISWKEAHIKWDLMLFSAGAYAVGNALNDSGGAEWMIQKLIAAIGLDKMNLTLVAIVLIFISVFSHMIFTSKTVRTTIMIPAVLTLAQQLGMNPVPIALACSFAIAYTITLPPHSKVNTLYFGAGWFDVKDELVFGLVSCFIASCVLCFVYFFWLQLIF